MTIKNAYVDLLRHFGRTSTVDALFRDARRPDMIALRHDIDHDLDLALAMAHIEHALGHRATYYLLHTHEYWHDPMLVDKCLQLVEYGHEVGLHLNVLTEWMEGRIVDLTTHIRDLLRPLREAGVNIVGTSAHGDRACYEHQFINYWIWRELRGDEPAAQENGRSAEGIHVAEPRHQITYPADERIRRPDGVSMPVWNVSMQECGLLYDAVHVHHDHYWTDTGGRWTRSDDPLRHDLSRGRHQVLVHPFWWRDLPRKIIINTIAPDDTTYLAQAINEATSCRGRANSLLADDDGRVLTNDTSHRETALETIRQTSALWRAEPRDVIEVTDRLGPFIADWHRYAPETELWQLHAPIETCIQRAEAFHADELNASSRDGAAMNGAGDAAAVQDEHTEARDHWLAFTAICQTARLLRDRIAGFAHDTITISNIHDDHDDHKDHEVREDYEDLVSLFTQLEARNIIVHPLLARNVLRRYRRHKQHAPLHLTTWQRLFGRFETGAPTRNRREQQIIDRVFGARFGMRRSKALLKWKPDVVPTMVLRNVVAVQTAEGLRLRTEAEGNPTSYALWPSGTWSRMEKTGWRTDAFDQYTLAINAVVDAHNTPAATRVFVIWFNEFGERLMAEHIATLDTRTPHAACRFVAPTDARGFSVGLHFGPQPPDHTVLITSFRLDRHPLGTTTDITVTPPPTAATRPAGHSTPACEAASRGA
jgi:hypothetical protein